MVVVGRRVVVFVVTSVVSWVEVLVLRVVMAVLLSAGLLRRVRQVCNGVVFALRSISRCYRVVL